MDCALVYGQASGRLEFSLISLSLLTYLYDVEQSPLMCMLSGE